MASSPSGSPALLRPLGPLPGPHLSDLITSCLLPLAVLSSLPMPLPPLYRNLCTISLGHILSSLLSLLQGWSSPRVSLPQLASAGLSLLALPASSRPASYTVYWAVICLQPLTRAVTRAAPRSFTYGEAAVVCQGVLLLAASLVLQLVALPIWSVRTVLLGLGGWVETIVTVLQDQSGTVAGLVAFWSVLGLASVAVVPLYRLLAWRVTTATRKIFHLSVLLVFTSGLALCPLLLSLASVVAALGLTSLELLRVSRILPALSSSLTHHLAPFLDSKDPGPLILTPLYLLVGVSWPLWLWPAPLPLPSAPLPLYSGLASVAVLDSAASVLGSTFGSLRWNSSSSRTVEGSLAGWLAAMAYIYLLDLLELTSVSSWPGLGLVVAALALAEAACSQVDNLVLPLAMYVMLLALQHLS